MAVCGSCFCGIDHTDSPYGYCWLPIRRGKNICLLSGNDLVMADLPFGPLSGEGERTENIDRKKSYVFVANHQGAFDIFLIYGFLGVLIKWVMKAGIAKIPFVELLAGLQVLSLSIIRHRKLPPVACWRRNVA